MTQQFENFVNAALDKSLSSDVTLPTANEIPVFTGIGRQVTGKTTEELGLALTTDLDTDGTLAANSDTKYPSQKAVKTYADTKQAERCNSDSTCWIGYLQQCGFGGLWCRLRLIHSLSGLLQVQPRRLQLLMGTE